MFSIKLLLEPHNIMLNWNEQKEYKYPLNRCLLLQFIICNRDLISGFFHAYFIPCYQVLYMYGTTKLQQYLQGILPVDAPMTISLSIWADTGLRFYKKEWGFMHCMAFVSPS